MADMDTGDAKRRHKRWPDALKGEIVAATFEPGASVSMVARQYDVNANQVFSWRRRYREAGGSSPASSSTPGSRSGLPRSAELRRTSGRPSAAIAKSWLGAIRRADFTQASRPSTVHQTSERPWLGSSGGVASSSLSVGTSAIAGSFNEWSPSPECAVHGVIVVDASQRGAALPN